MEYLVALLLAVIQGLTEFVPVSSSGHLALTQYFLGFTEPPVAFDLVLHIGTVVAVFIFYRHDLWKMLQTVKSPMKILAPDMTSESPGKLLLLLMIACVPTAVIGFLLKSRVESSFSDIRFLAYGFLISALIMFMTLARRMQTRSLADMNMGDAVVIGTLQGVALFPGISRSGSTISAALLLGIRPEVAGRFSFLLSIPAVVGAVALESKAIATGIGEGNYLLMYLICGLLAGVIGYLSLAPLIRILQKSRFHYFAIYCGLLGTVLLVYIWHKTT